MINALKLFHDIISFQTIKHVIPVATSAVREAINKDDFLKEAYQETGFRFRVLSGKAEVSIFICGSVKSHMHTNCTFF